MDLDIKRVLAAKPGAPEDIPLNQLVTRWGDTLDTAHVLDDYPRPQMRRESWTCLNGWWEYAIVESVDAQHLWEHARPPKVWDGHILVPFSPEAALSGVKRQLLPNQLLWYRREVELCAVLAQRQLILHFEAVDYACAVYVNGERVATHKGGYLPFWADVTTQVHEGRNVLEVCVADPSEQGTQLRGKQRLRRANMWYTAQSGIWQTVWMEEVPVRHIESVRMHANPDDGMLVINATVDIHGDELLVDVLDAEGQTVASANGIVREATTSMALTVEEPHAWEPDDPYLYQLRLTYGKDVVRSYCAFRCVGIEPDDKGVPRFCLNHRPLFVKGLLDQGYWPDGLMTAPSDDAMIADIAYARQAGFNLLRKHIKIEPARWYWHCDRLGMLVWQDMVSGGDIPGEWTSVNIPTLVRRSWTTFGDTTDKQWRRMGAGDVAYRSEWTKTAHATLDLLGSHPCVVGWVVFNESWGQFDSARNTEELRTHDPSRPYVSACGWYDQGAGDVWSVHNYFRGMRVYRDPHAGLRGQRRRAFMIGEFGGLVCPIEGHVSVPTTYGYDTFDDAATWRAALVELLNTVSALEDEGLSGFVYTQLSDVEEETNGLLTYDRRVDKLA